MSKNPTTEPIYLTPERAAELTGVSSRTVYRQLAAGAFSARRMGGRTVIDAASWREFLANLPVYQPGAMLPCHPAKQRRKLPRKSSKREVR
jgi:excisionase family DNA binding protein